MRYRSRALLLVFAAANAFLYSKYTFSYTNGSKYILSTHGSHEMPSTYLVEFEEAGLLRQSQRNSGERFVADDPTLAYSRDRLIQAQRLYEARIADTLGRHPEISHRYLVTHSGIAVRLNDHEATAIAQLPGVVSVRKEAIEPYDTHQTPAFIGAPSIWNGSAVPGGMGTRGEGMIIAMLDGGIVPTHPSFVNDAACGHGSSRPNKILSMIDCSTTDAMGMCNGPTPEDGNGHGSHTSSIAGGNAVPTSAVPSPGAEPISGVAPCAHLRSYRVCFADCHESFILAGMNAVLIHGDVDVMNFSIRGGTNPWRDTDRKKLDLVDAGVFVAASAGNIRATIPDPVGQVYHRGPWVMSVAASDLNDELAWFSLRGPTPAPLANLTKPDIAAPGVAVYAASMTGYGTMDGTSMSSPHVAGGAALIRKIHPNWTPMEVKSALMMTAERSGAGDSGNWTWDEVGSGRIDLTKAARVGLVMDETTDDFLAADPEGGSIDVRELNLPAVRDVQCKPSCSFTRTVRSTLPAPSSWVVTIKAPSGFDLQVSPAAFMIAPGSTQTLTTTATPMVGEPGTEIRFGTINLAPLMASAPAQHITVALQGQGLVDKIFHNGFDDLPIFVSGSINHQIADNVFGTSIGWAAGRIVDDIEEGADIRLAFTPNAPGDPNKLTVHWGLTPSTSAAVAATADSSNLSALSSGVMVGPASTFARTTGEMLDWASGATGYIGFRFDCSSLSAPPPDGRCYGYMHLRTTGPNGHPATILDYAFNRYGEPITIP